MWCISALLPGLRVIKGEFGMGIFHFSMNVITRSKGESVVAAAAYRAGEKMENIYDGQTHDYTSKKNILYKKLMVPPELVGLFKNREELWNRIELSEKAKNAQLAREFNVALPIEIGLAHQIVLLEEFVERNFVCKGMIADIVIHNPPAKNENGRFVDKKNNETNNPDEFIFRNPHAHILLTMRPFNKDGSFQYKFEKEYICKDNEGSIKRLTSKEMKLPENENYKKQYMYFKGSERLWLTAEEGRSQNLKRTNRNPRASKFERQNPLIKQWNSKEQLMNWRHNWALAVNEKYEELGIEDRISEESYQKQGLEIIPSTHVGPIRKGQRQLAVNKEIFALNNMSEVMDDVDGCSIDYLHKQKQEINVMEFKLKTLKDEIDKIDEANINTNNKLNGIKANTRALSSKEYKEQIKMLENELAVRENYKKYIITKAGYLDEADIKNAEEQLTLRKVELDKLLMNYKNATDILKHDIKCNGKITADKAVGLVIRRTPLRTSRVVSNAAGIIRTIKKISEYDDEERRNSR